MSESIDENELDVQAHEDIKRNKFVAMVGYIFFFVPLAVALKSKFARFHANQSLVLFLTFICMFFTSALIPIIGPNIVFPFTLIFTAVLAIIGIINAGRGKMKKLPVIGSMTILRRVF